MSTSGDPVLRHLSVDAGLHVGVTPVFALADEVVEASAADDPAQATISGIPGHDDRLTDYSPAAAEQRAQHLRSWLTRLRRLSADSGADRLALAVMRERLDVRLRLHEAGEHLRDCNGDLSPVQLPREMFTLMRMESEADWGTVARRLQAVPASLASLRSAYLTGAASGVSASRRQALAAARSAAVIAGLEGEGTLPPQDWFGELVADYGGPDETLRRRLHVAAREASRSYAELAQWLRVTFAPQATPADAVGPDRYALLARYHCGTDLDLHETYAWGWDELARIAERVNQCAARMYGGLTPAEVRNRLRDDPQHDPGPPEHTAARLQQLTDDTFVELNGTYFDIPEIMRSCEVRLAPPGTAAVPYYTPPSEDFSRPGRAWLPASAVMPLPLWWLRSMWFHETVPGHHLQTGYALLQRERLSRFQRVEAVTGHGEGWALYAERLMDELGYLQDPPSELGYLSGQALRAARVVLDIGLHLGLPVPQDVHPGLLAGVAGDPRGAVWTSEFAAEFLAGLAGIPADLAYREILRYLGSPAQAISYKVGERVWLQAREEAARSAGAAFDLKAWHMRALSFGSVPLAVLRSELAGPIDLRGG